MRLTYDHSQAEAGNIWTFYFKPAKPVQYTPGQYIELTVDHNQPDDRGNRRWFTLSSSPNEPLLSITTKFAAHNSSSFKTALKQLAPGTEVTMSDPMGDFVLPKLVQTPLIFVAGGIGITPFHSIFSWLAETHESRPIRFIYGVNNEDEIIFQTAMAKAGVHATIVVGQPTDAWGGERGKITAELVLGLQPPTDESLIYISGPETMVVSLAKDLRQAGIERRQIVSDEFTGYASL